jgi:hypothetical protein
MDTGEHHDACIRAPAPDIADHFGAAGKWHRNIQREHVGLVLPCSGQGFNAVLSLGAYHHAFGCYQSGFFESGAQTVTNNLVIISDDNTVSRG